MSVEPADEEVPWFRILVARPSGDLVVRGLVEEAASAFRARGATVVVTEDADFTPPPDGVLVVAAGEADLAPVEAVAPRLVERGVAIVAVGPSREDAAATAHRLRAAYRAARAFVVPRQLSLERTMVGTFGLDDDEARERLEGIIDLLLHESERLLAKRSGWEDAQSKEGKEWLGPHVREREDEWE